MSETISPAGAVESAAAAAEAIRTLNYATLSPGRVVADGAAETYAVIGELRILLERVPQALEQLAAALETDVDWRTDDGSDPAGRVRYAATELRETASTIAVASQRDNPLPALAHLNAAHSHVSHLYIASGDERAGE